MSLASDAKAPAIVLGVFAKWPSPGRAKTRLIPLLGPQGAADAAMRLLTRSLQWIDGCPPEVHAVLWTDGGLGSDWQEVLSTLQHPGRWQLRPQAEGHLGERMKVAMQWQLDMHGRSTCSLIMGTDTPTLGCQHIESVCKGLQQNDAVFVPALDGGYVMVGMRRLCEPAFAALDWGTERVAQQTQSALAAGGFSQSWLAPEPDLDEPADWEKAVAEGWV